MTKFSITKIFRFLFIYLILTEYLVCATYYIDSYLGSDSSGDGSAIKPWSSLDYSLNQITSGDTLFLRKGNYSFKGLQNVYGTYQKLFESYVSIVAYPNEVVTITNKVKIGSPWHVLPGEDRLLGAYNAYIKLSGITFSDGIELLGAKHLIIDNCVISSTKYVLNGTSNENLEIINSAGVNCIGCNNIQITNCIIKNSGIGIILRESSYCLGLNLNMFNFTQDGIQIVSSQYCVFDNVNVSICDDGVNDTDIDPDTGSPFPWNRHSDCMHIYIGGSKAPIPNKFCIVRNSHLWHASGAGIQFNNYVIYAGTAWQKNETYFKGDSIYYDGVRYLCEKTHVASVFASDLAAVYWMKISDLIVNSDMVFENNIIGPTSAITFNSSDITHRVLLRHNSFRQANSTFSNPNAYVKTGSITPQIVEVKAGSLRYSSISETQQGTTAGAAIYNNILGIIIPEIPLNKYCDYNLIEYGGTLGSFPRATIVQENTNNFTGDISDPKLIVGSKAIDSGTLVNRPSDPDWYNGLLSHFKLSQSALLIDRFGNKRDLRPDMGAYEAPTSNAAPEELIKELPPTNVFYDDFEDANLQADLYIYSLKMTPLSWKQLTPEYPMKIVRRSDAFRNVLEAVREPEKTSFISSSEGAKWSDYKLEFDVVNYYIIENDGPCMLICDRENYYYVDIGAESGRIIRVLNGVRSIIGSSSKIRSVYNVPEKYAITVTHTDKIISFSVDKGSDGTVDFSCTDDSVDATNNFISGDIGFLRTGASKSQYRCQYDNVRLTLYKSVDKVKPIIKIAPIASKITSRQTLAAAILSGGMASVPGVFHFSDPQASPPLGTSKINVTFTPNDIINYSNVIIQVPIEVVAVIAPPAIAPIEAQSASVGQLFFIKVSASNNPTHFSASGLPSGLMINSATGVISGVPSAAGSFTISLLASNSGGSGFAIFPINIAPLAPPVLSLASPISTKVGIPFFYQIIAQNSSNQYDALNLPLGLTIQPLTGLITGIPNTAGSFTVTLSASNVSGTGTNSIIISVAKGDQSINFPAPSMPVRAGQPIELNATSSAGLPITYSITSGNASLSGNGLTIHTTGAVVVRAVQAGNANYNSASAELLIDNITASLSQSIYLGNIGSDSFACSISPDGKSGMLYVYLSATDEAVVLSFTISGDGSFEVSGAGIMASTGQGQTDVEKTLRVFAMAPSQKTFRGRIIEGKLTGILEELNLPFSGTLQPEKGITASIAGVYRANATGSASGSTYIVIGTQGQVFGLSTIAGNLFSGMGTITPDGAFSIQSPKSASITGTMDPTTMTIAASILSSDQPAIPISGLQEKTPRTDRLVNLSARARIGNSDASKVFISGFIINGSAPKQVLLRAVGPGLASYGIEGVLSDPQLQLFNQSGNVIAQNNDWLMDTVLDEATDRAGAFRLANGSRDSALFVTLEPGAYTMRASSANGEGVALLEIYNADTTATTTTSEIVNLSTRGYVETDEGVLIGGFVIRGNAPKRILLRGIGPALKDLGVPDALADPIITLYRNGTLLAQNDNWETPTPVSPVQIPASATEIASTNTITGAFPLTLGSKDSAIIILLSPGNYSAIVRGSANSRGTALLEVYQLAAQ